MLTVLAVIAAVATAAACAFALIAWGLRREARRRSTARVAALSAAIDGREPEPYGAVALEDYQPEHPLAAPLFVVETPSRRRWMIAAGVAPVALIVAALLVTRGPQPAPRAPSLHQPESLELLAMHHDTAGGALTVTGTVRVRGRDTAPVTAVVTGRDGNGRVVASAHAPLDDAGLDLDGESSFQVAVPGHDVRRYQVRFETPLGPLTHVDRRGAGPGSALP
jgi:hypothetical protein